ncbi:hypothetical protein EDB83DRAFT_439867 [Lactarius deliciosus]|nr:hypothetical protein EDB83DRAFT_439867 [Lactarius deliciosus]
MMTISATGPGDDPATPVSHKTTNNRASTKKYGRRRRDARCSGRTGPTSSQPRVPPRRMSKMLLFLPSTSESTSSKPPPRQCDRDRDHDALNIISIDTSSSSSRSPPPLRCPRKTKTQRGQVQLMAFVLVLPLPPAPASHMLVKQRSRTRQRQTAAKWKARTGDNSGSMELVCVLQVAFENNWPGAGSTGPSGKMTKKAAKETVVVVDDEDDEEEESDKFQDLHAPRPGVSCGIHTQLNKSYRGVSTGSDYYAPIGKGDTRWVADETRGRLCHRVERGDAIRTRRTVHADNDDAWQTSRTMTTLMTSKSRSSSMHRGNNSAYPCLSLNHNRLPDRSLDISPAVLPSSIARQPRLPYTRLSLFTRPHPSRRRPRRSTLYQSRPQRSTRSQASRWRSFQNLHARRSRSPHAHSATCTRRPILQIPRANYKRRNSTRPAGFCYEGAAVGAHGLLATSPAAEPILLTAALVPPPPTLPPQLQLIPMICRMRVCISTSNSISLWTSGMGPLPAGEDESADTHAVVVGDALPHSHPPLLRTADTYNHSDGRILGFVILEHDNVDHSLGASVDVGRALTTPSQGLSFDLTSSNRGGEGSIDWCVGSVFGGARCQHRHRRWRVRW